MHTNEKPMADFEARLARLEAINHIRKVVHQMTLLQDRPYAIETVEYYASDAVLVSGSFGNFEGRESIRELYRFLPESVSSTLHYKFGSVVDVDASAETATATWVSIETPVVKDQAVIGAVRQESAYKVEDGEWRVARYEQELLCMAPYEDGWLTGVSLASAWDPTKS
jgi:hypothetical protein